MGILVRALAGVVAGLLVSSAVPSAAVAAPGDELRLTFDGGGKRAGDRMTRFFNQGAADLAVRVVSRDGGTAHRARGRGSWAVRLPAFREGSSPPRAVIRVANDGSRDRLEPGTARFRFGAEFRLNKTSSGSRVDDGDNLIQRGLWGDAAQYKLQVDSRRVMCSVKGSAGRRSVTSPVRVRPTHWYRAACVRDGSGLRLRVWHFHDGGVTSRTTRVSGRTGSLSFGYRVPLSIGGKLRSGGGVAPSTDQLNGLVDKAFLNIR